MEDTENGQVGLGLSTLEAIRTAQGADVNGLSVSLSKPPKDGMMAHKDELIYTLLASCICHVHRQNMSSAVAGPDLI